jgi:hypothetical protein
MKGEVIMKTSTKLIATGAASVLGVALAVGGASAATGSLSVANAPGHVLQVSGVAPAAAHASGTATTHANPNAKGLFGDPAEHATPHATPHATTHATPHATTHATAMPRSGVSQVAPPAAQSLPMHHAEVHSPEPVHSAPGMHMSRH